LWLRFTKAMPFPIKNHGFCPHGLLTYTYHLSYIDMPPVAEHHTLQTIDRLIANLQHAERKHQTDIEKVHVDFRESARNLIHYFELRKEDQRHLQHELGAMGLSRLARAEEHVLSSLTQTAHWIYLKGGHEPSALADPPEHVLSKDLLTHHTKKVLGPADSHRRARIMVTMPTDIIHDPQLVVNMIQSGMNVARINCAHDDETIWLQMIEVIRNASEALAKPVKIVMDLAGPKLRTGAIEDGPAVIRISPKRDGYGNPIEAGKLVCYTQNQAIEPKGLPLVGNVNPAELDGNVYSFRDARGKKRKLLFSIEPDNVLVASFDRTTYLLAGTPLNPTTQNLPHLSIGPIPPKRGALVLSVGDYLRVDLDSSPGTNEIEGSIARVPCTLPEAIMAAQKGHKIYFDDGKIKGEIVEKNESGVVVRITRTTKPNTKLRAEKGINLPDTQIPIRGLTQKDRHDLRFIAQHADGVNVSFLSSPCDIRDLLEVLQQINAPENLAVILKIETRQAFVELRDILLTSMQWPTLGIMIARGDLALETGWENMGRVQKEIIKMTAAAHVPVIWATQVLDNLAKKGYPSRSEVTDAMSSIRSECVMLNKGPYILKAIQFLDRILAETEEFQQKNYAMLPKMLKLS
jgi:pyruvate kinase